MEYTTTARAVTFVAVLALTTVTAFRPAGAAETVDSDTLNVAAEFNWTQVGSEFALTYRADKICKFELLVGDGDGWRKSGPDEATMGSFILGPDKISQQIALNGSHNQELLVRGTVFAGAEALAAETLTDAQKRFPLIRATAGRSRNLRNNAVYDRTFDWVLIGPGDGRTRIEPIGPDGAERRFAWESRGKRVTLEFRPLYYQRHKNLPHYEPWTYKVWKGSIAGWCSWWAYRRDFDLPTLEKVVNVLAAQNLADFGYRYIQIDDTFQTSMGMADGWLLWDKKKFPGGAAGAVSTIRAGNFEPGIWVYSAFHDEEAARAHPDWFVRNTNGELFKGPWVGYGLDGNSAEAVAAVVGKTERGFRDLGFRYVKIDSLRHLLYDSYHHAIDHLAAQGAGPADTFRRYLGAARAELGRDIFVLACWGVLPEAIGIADACRLGGDGFGPATLQQYNSWNGIVWRNDPDHCDILPTHKPKEKGNVIEVEDVEACSNDAIQRPCLVSMASGMLMLSDRAEVYSSARNLEGAKRSAPIVFTVPGQLYDFDPRKTDTIIATKRTEIVHGGPPSPIDADQNGEVCVWWMMEIEKAFESWTVLAHFNWEQEELAATTVAMSDLGLRADREFLVYEFWTKEFVGACRESFDVPALEPGGTQIFVLRERLDRPQLLSTSRHITQGAVDLLRVQWDAEQKALTGCSAVVENDRYELVVHVPEGYAVASAAINGSAVEVDQSAVESTVDGSLVRIAALPAATGPMTWTLHFEK